MHNLQKQKWEKARGQLIKTLAKDSLNAAAYYGLSVYYVSMANPAYQLDSAYSYTLKALSHYHLAQPKQRDRWKRIPLDSLIIGQQRIRIDSAAFNRALKINTEAGYIDFINRFPTASQLPLANELRDEVAYIDALRENTYQSFFTYLSKYPSAGRAKEAKDRYERLLYEAKTKDKKLLSYESFLFEYPSTPYRKIVEQQIFEIITAGGSVEDFEKFLRKYPGSSKAQAARNILFHILKEEDHNTQSWSNDSINRVESLSQTYLVPFLKGGKFGFMNEQGTDIINPVFEEIQNDYRCGNVKEELLVLDNKIMARNGAVIYQGEIDEVEELGYGFLKITTSRCVQVIHFSGVAIGHGECFEDAMLLRQNFIALQKEKKWSVWTLTGRMLMSFEWDDIRAVHSVIVFERRGKFRLASPGQLAKTADQVPVRFLYSDLDEVKAWPNNKIWFRKGDEQAVLNQNLTEWIKKDQHEISSTFFGAVSKHKDGYTLFHHSGISQTFEQIKINNPWVAGKSAQGWQVWDPGITHHQVNFDSIGFAGPIVVAFKNDSVRVRMTNTSYIESLTVKPKFLPGKDSIFFLLIEEGDRKKIYNNRCEFLFAVSYDHIEYNNEGFFTIHKKGKRGLITSEGKLIIQPEYDAMGTVKDGIVTLLKERKFGLMNLKTRKQIKTEFEKNVLFYNQSHLIAFKNGLYGLIGWNNKPVTPFEFEEIQFWNDSAALVRKKFNWMIYNFIEKKIEVDKVKRFKWVLNTQEEKIIILQQENSYGVLSSRRGIVIAPTFSDIINLGSSTTPLYFTEKHVEEAAIYIVIYYDRNGHQLRKQVFEVEEYERIYCNKNSN